MHVVCTDLLCVVCIGLLSVEFSTVKGRPYIFETSVSVEYSSGSGYHKLSTCIDYLNFQPKSSTFSEKYIRSFEGDSVDNTNL